MKLMHSFKALLLLALLLFASLVSAVEPGEWV